jgi:Malic enzyme, N-terminal domain
MVKYCGKTGAELLHDARYNKGTAFTLEERRVLKLEGLLPSHVSTQDEQVLRAFNLLDTSCPTELDKYSFLQTINNRNQKLFFRLMEDRLTELMPIAYTPTVGLAVSIGVFFVLFLVTVFYYFVWYAVCLLFIFIFRFPTLYFSDG